MLIWRPRWVTDSGAIVECREALAMPGEPDRVLLLRRLLVVQGETEVAVEFEPAAGFGRLRVDDLRLDPDGCWAGRLGSLRMRWSAEDIDFRAPETPPEPAGSVDGYGCRRGRVGTCQLDQELPGGSTEESLIRAASMPANSCVARTNDRSGLGPHQ